MYKFILSTDSCCDECTNNLKTDNISCIPMSYITTEEKKDNFNTSEEYKHFYDEMRRGVLPSTSSLNIFELEEYFENLIKLNKQDILHLCLSSGLSVNYDNTVKAAEEVMKKYPNYRILVPDIKCATQSQNLMLQIAKQYRNEGKSAEGSAQLLLDNENSVNAWFYVSDLMYLKKGGRINSAQAMIGTLLKMRPICTINSVGKLAIVDKVSGTKKAIKHLASIVKDRGFDFDKNPIYICHSDDPVSAQELKERLQEEIPGAKIIINYIGPVIGSHTGPEAVGVVFMGKDRVK
jgi:DegV family protein with EDD domain